MASTNQSRATSAANIDRGSIYIIFFDLRWLVLSSSRCKNQNHCIAKILDFCRKNNLFIQKFFFNFIKF